jgi:hypothetical protein
MSETSKVPESVRMAAEQHGLTKALKLYPDGVQAAAERGLRPLGQAPQGSSPIASPAHIFNPARFEKE